MRAGRGQAGGGRIKGRSAAERTENFDGRKDVKRCEVHGAEKRKGRKRDTFSLVNGWLRQKLGAVLLTVGLHRVLISGSGLGGVARAVHEGQKVSQVRNRHHRDAERLFHILYGRRFRHDFGVAALFHAVQRDENAGRRWL